MTDPLYELVDAVAAMHKADEAYGCGFYNDEDWIAAYARTKELAVKFGRLSSKTEADRDA